MEALRAEAATAGSAAAVAEALAVDAEAVVASVTQQLVDARAAGAGGEIASLEDQLAAAQAAATTQTQAANVAKEHAVAVSGQAGVAAADTLAAQKEVAKAQAEVAAASQEGEVRRIEILLRHAQDALEASGANTTCSDSVVAVAASASNTYATSLRCQCGSRPGDDCYGIPFYDGECTANDATWHQVGHSAYIRMTLTPPYIDMAPGWSQCLYPYDINPPLH